MELGLHCSVCGSKYEQRIKTSKVCYCPNCQGLYGSSLFAAGDNITQEELDRLSIYLFYNPIEKHYICCYGEKIYSMVKDDRTYVALVTKDMVNAWYPRTFAQKIDKVLLYLGSNTKYYGQEFISNNSGEIKKLFFINDLGFSNETAKELSYFANYMFEEKYLEGKRINHFVISNMGVLCNFTLTPKALARVDELQKDINNNKDVFVAMAFNDDTKPTREAIRAGIKGAKFSDKFIDEIIHNQQIVPYMMRLIRDCRFLIMDITEPNYGAYYEAGYALGLGKEVIITCRQDIFSKKIYKDELEEKALKPHFDIVQRQILVWENEEDLSAKLKQWILELATRKR